METITSAMMELDKLPDPFSLSFHSLSDETSTINHRTPPPPFQTLPIPQPQHLKTYCTPDSVDAMREMIFRMAALQPIHDIDVESVKPPKRRNVKISKDPQSVAARHRRERISERIRILQRLIPGGTKMDTASMLDEAVRYMKFLKKQVQSFEQFGGKGLANQFGY